MPLILKLARTGYVPDLDELQYADATGSYDAATNPGGYGGPNPLRNTLALYLVGEMMGADGAVTAGMGAPAGDTDSPRTRTSLALRPGRDGYLSVRLVAFPVVASVAGSGGEQNDTFFDALTGTLRRLVSEAWLPAPAPGTSLPAGGPLPRTARLSDRVAEALTPRAQVLRARLTERVAGLYYDGQPETYQNAADQHLLRLDAASRALLAAADICWQRGQPFLFALRVERLTALSGEAAVLLA